MSKTVYEILEEVASTSSKNEKEAILKQHADNKTLRECFRLAYSPTIRFYNKKVVTPSTNEIRITLDQALNMLLVNVAGRVVTGMESSGYIGGVLKSLSFEDADVAKRVILQDLRCGVQSTTINKIWKGLIPEVPQMLASSMKEKTLAKIKYPAAAELKSDGARCIAYCNVDGVRLMSRNGKQYIGLTDLENTLQHKLCDGLVLDGEIVFDISKADRSTGNGIVTKAVKGTITQEEQSKIVFQVWDVLPQDKYIEKGKINVPQKTRYEDLKGLVNSVNKSNLQLIPTTIVNSLYEAREVYQQYVDQGFEGIILKNLDSGWSDSRSPNLVKFKEELFADLEVVGLFEGSGKISGMLGGLHVESSDGLISTNVGSGFTEEQRRVLWDNRDDLIGKIVEIKYNGLTQDKRTGKKSLFLPIFQHFREDKDKANSSKDMQ